VVKISNERAIFIKKRLKFCNKREKTPDIVDDNYLGGLNGQMELERRRFAG